VAGTPGFELRQLRHAVALSEHRNFARAADTLHITQSALTRSIQALEARLGARLFDRGQRDVTPTMLGELVLRHAAALELAARDLQRDVELAKGLEIGELRIGAGPFAGAAITAWSVGRLSEAHPRLRTEVVIGPWQELPERIRQRQVDLIVGDMRDIGLLDGFEVRALEPHPMVWVCRAGHPLTSGPAVSFPELLAYPLAGPRLPGEVLAWLQRQLPDELSGMRGSPVTITCDSSEVLKRILIRSNAISMMSPFMLADELRDGRLVALPYVGEGIDGRYGAAWLKGRTLSTPARVFLDLLVEDDARLAEMERSMLKDPDAAG
jgi:DNA-binding transcriptional LysR family regulator